MLYYPIAVSCKEMIEMCFDIITSSYFPNADSMRPRDWVCIAIIYDTRIIICTIKSLDNKATNR